MSTDLQDSVAPLRAWLDAGATPSADEARALKRRADAGDRAAFESLVRAAMKFALGRAHAYHRATDFDLDECVSAAQLAAVECATKFDPDRGSLCSYLSCRVRTLLADARRKAAHAPPTTVGDYDFDQVPDHHADRLDRAELVREAIARLPEPLRRVIELQVDEDLNSAEIARREGLDPQLVRQRLRNAQSLLRADLQERLDDV